MRGAQETLFGFVVTPVVAEEHGVIVLHRRIVGTQPQRAAVMLLGELTIAMVL